MQQKFEIAQKHINDIDLRIKMFTDSIARENSQLQEYLKTENYYWVNICAKKITEYYNDLTIEQTKKKEMQELLNFLTK